MNWPLRLLLVEDQEDDAALVLLELARCGYQVMHSRVDTRAQMAAALTSDTWDLVLSDYSMPSFSALEALAVLRGSGLDLPFIIVSGTIGEETAVESLRAGAHDFLVKDRLARLGTAVERELRAARDRAAQREEERRNGELELARENAERLSRFKSQFLANMSHELRTPLNAIIGFSEVLQIEAIAGPLAERQRQYVDHILESGRHLLRLINDVLDLSSVEAGRIELRREWMAPKSLIDGVGATVRPLAQKQGIVLTIRAATLPPLFADPVRIKQILYNLLSNAIKFTPRGGSVLLDASTDGAQLVVAVTDTGVGISAEELPRLFHEFERIIEPTGPRFEGTGLGLALTKRLVEEHGGTVTVVSTFGQGSTFTVSLPLPPPQPDTTMEALP